MKLSTKRLRNPFLQDTASSGQTGEVDGTVTSSKPSALSYTAKRAMYNQKMVRVSASGFSFFLLLYSDFLWVCQIEEARKEDFTVRIPVAPDARVTETEVSSAIEYEYAVRYLEKMHVSAVPKNVAMVCFESWHWLLFDSLNCHSLSWFTGAKEDSTERLGS